MTATINFNARLLAEVERKHSQLCLGLDLDPERTSSLHGNGLKSLQAAARLIVDATCHLVWGYKLNFAFFERFGSAGYAWLEQLAAHIGDRAMIIGDAKRGDIGNSARNYARAVFGHLNLDAVTVNPYMGRDAVTPFIADPSRGAFILCLTSNPGSGDFQRYPAKRPLYLEVAAWAERLNGAGNVGLVTGATHPDDLAGIRRAAPSLPFLAPGIGAQGGSLEQALAAGTNETPTIISVSRGVLYAGEGTLEDIVAAVGDYNRQISNLA